MPNDLDDDFPINGGSEKLAKLFEENTPEDISFKFKLPKQASQKPSQNSLPLKVLFAKTVDAFQMKVSGYTSEGKVGLAIIGNDESCYYQLYMYRSDEKKVASAVISLDFEFTLQENNYATFKDSHSIQWSVHFDKSSDIVSFSKEIAMAQWKSIPGNKTKLVQDAIKEKTIEVRENDIIPVGYNIYTVSPPDSFNLQEIDKISPPATESSPRCSPDSLTTITASQSSEDHKLGSNLTGRMARIGYHLPSLRVMDSESNSNLSEKFNTFQTNVSSRPPSKISEFLKDENCLHELSDVSMTSQFNVLFSEVRTSNSEMRMNISRVTDKVDTVLSKIQFPDTQQVLPFLERIQNHMNSISEQYSQITSCLAKNFTSNIDSTSNEILKLRERNSELEILLGVSQSTSQKLRNEVDELNRNATNFDKFKTVEVCSSCNVGAEKVNDLEICLKEMEESNCKLSEAMEETDKKYRELVEELTSLDHNSHQQLLILHQQLKEKETLLSELEKDHANYDCMMRGQTSDKAVVPGGRELLTVVKGLMNAAYNAIKSDLRKENQSSLQLEESIAHVLREVTQDFLEKQISSGRCRSLCERHEKTQRDLAGGAVSHVAPTTNCQRLPVPKPRKALASTPTYVKVNPHTPSTTDHPKSSRSTSPNIPSHDAAKETDSTSKLKNDILTYQSKELSEGKEEFPDILEDTHCKKTETIIGVVGSDESIVLKSSKNYQRDMPDNSIKGSSDMHQVNDDPSSNGESAPGINFFPSYSCNYYTPFIPTTPPPITQDFLDSDDRQFGFQFN